MFNEAKITFLEKSISVNHSLRDGMDNKANFLLAVASVLMAFSLPGGSVFTIVFSFVAVFFCVLAILGFRFGKIQNKSLVCWWGLKGKSFEEYKEAIDGIKTEEDLILEYEKEIYSLFRSSIRLKMIFVKIAAVSLILALASALINYI